MLVPPLSLVNFPRNSSRNGFEDAISEEIVNQWLRGVVGVDLRCDTLNVERNSDIGAGGNGTPPFACDGAAGKDKDHAPYEVIVAPSVCLLEICNTSKDSM